MAVRTRFFRFQAARTMGSSWLFLAFSFDSFYILLKNSLFLAKDGPGSGGVEVDVVDKELEAPEPGNRPDLAARAADSCSHFF